MAWTKVGQDIFNAAAGATGQTVSLPGGIAQNDIVIALIASDNNFDATYVGIETSGYSILSAQAASDPGEQLKYKLMGATPDSIISYSGSDFRKSAGIFQVWNGEDTSTPIDNSITLYLVGFGTVGDPPAHTTVTANALRIVGFAKDDDDDAGELSAPTGYSNLIANDTATDDSINGATVALASKEDATADEEDPAAFGISGSPGSEPWFSYHFALRPAGAGGGGRIMSSLAGAGGLAGLGGIAGEGGGLAG